MFSEACVSHSVHGGGGFSPSGQTSHPAATSAVGTHPTGMHSCYNCEHIIDIILTTIILFLNLVMTILSSVWIYHL